MFSGFGQCPPNWECSDRSGPLSLISFKPAPLNFIMIIATFFSIISALPVSPHVVIEMPAMTHPIYTGHATTKLHTPVKSLPQTGVVDGPYVKVETSLQYQNYLNGVMAPRGPNDVAHISQVLKAPTRLPNKHPLFKAAQANDADAQYGLGVYLAREPGAQHQQANVYFAKAADQGHKPAQFALGVANEYGHGTPVNHENAKSLYLDAHGSDPNFDVKLGQFLLKKGHPTVAKELLLRGTEANHPAAFKLMHKLQQEQS